MVCLPDTFDKLCGQIEPIRLSPLADSMIRVSGLKRFSVWYTAFFHHMGFIDHCLFTNHNEKPLGEKCFDCSILVDVYILWWLWKVTEERMCIMATFTGRLNAKDHPPYCWSHIYCNHLLNTNYGFVHTSHEYFMRNKCFHKAVATNNLCWWSQPYVDKVWAAKYCLDSSCSKGLCYTWIHSYYTAYYRQVWGSRINVWNIDLYMYPCSICSPVVNFMSEWSICKAIL